MIVKLSLFFSLFLLPILSFSQNLAELGVEKQRIEEKIEKLEDSLDFIKEKIEVFKEQNKSQKDLVEVIPEIREWVIARDAVLLTTPSERGETIANLQKGTFVKKVDQLGAYYLVCISGNCGYVHQDFLQKKTAEKKMNEKETKDGEKDKEFMG